MKLFSIPIIFLFLMIFLMVKSVLSVPKFTENIFLPKYGKLFGIQMPGFANGPFEAFFGIPFAEPPIGRLRFANPLPKRPWGENTLNATQEKPPCIQKNYLAGLNAPVVGEEDCLYLNIYRPICQTCTNLPVMVYIHGGGFFAGYAGMSFTGPEYFMDTKRVIIVTIAYRLGALGFLSTNDAAMPGNFGLKDQRLALKFVKENIEYFDGDPNRITIFGQSAGGASCHLHMLTQKNGEDLFQKAIIMSGNAGAAYNEPVKNPKKQAYLQGEYLGIENVGSMDTYELVDILRRIDAKTIVESGDHFKHWQVDPVVVFKNVIENSKDPEAFLTQHPREIIESGNYKKIPWMTGFVPFEGAVRTLQITEFENVTKEFNANFNYLFRKLLEVPEATRYFDYIIHFYMNSTYEINSKTKEGFEKILTDLSFLYPMYSSIAIYTHNANKYDPPLYVYRFNYEGPYSFSNIYTSKPGKYGIVHCDELIYLFRMHFMDNKGWKPFKIGSVDHQAVQGFVDAFVSFAEHHEDKRINKMPECKTQDVMKNYLNHICTYREFTNDSRGNLIIKNKNDFDEEAVHFWDSLFN